MDQSLKGYKKALKEDPEAASAKAEAIIKNTYRTLMSRGNRGCYIYSTDPETNAYFAELRKSIAYEQKQVVRAESAVVEKEESQSNQYPGLTLKILSHQEVKPYENAVPIYNMEIALVN